MLVLGVGVVGGAFVVVYLTVVPTFLFTRSGIRKGRHHYGTHIGVHKDINTLFDLSCSTNTDRSFSTFIRSGVDEECDN